MAQSLLDSGIGALLRKGADMQLVDHGFGPWTAGIENLVAQRRGIEDLAGTADIVWLKIRARIRYDQLTVDAKLIARTGMGRLAECEKVLFAVIGATLSGSRAAALAVLHNCSFGGSV